MRSAGASLWQLTKPPFSPKWGIPSFVKKEAKGGQNRRGPILSAGGYLPPTRLRRRSVKKCYRHLKFRAVIPALIPRLCRGEFCGQRASENLVDFPKPGARRCLSDARISTDEGAITQARSVRKNEHNFLLIFRTPLRPSKSGRSCNIFLWTSGNHAEAWFCIIEWMCNLLIICCVCNSILWLIMQFWLHLCDFNDVCVRLLVLYM